MKRHRLLSLALALLMALSFLPVKAHATNSDFVIEDGTLKEYRGPGGDVVIPEGVTSIEGYRSLSNPGPFAYNTSITSVTFPDSLAGGKYNTGSWFWTSNGEGNYFNIFTGCDNLKRITFGDNLEAIPLFKNLPALEQVDLPAKLEWIEEDAFSNCPALKTVNFPDGVTRIWPRAFSGCPSLTEVNLPNSLTQIEGAFSNSGITSLTVPEGVLYCSISGDNFVELSLPSTLTTLPSLNCPKLRKLTLSPECWAFKGISRADLLTVIASCPALETIENCPNEFMDALIAPNVAIRDNWTDTLSTIAPQSARITKLSHEITTGLTTDYDKAQAIVSWVSKNIKYDDDYYYEGLKDYSDVPFDPEETLDKGKAVCAGFARLTQALLVAQDIPCLYVLGWVPEGYHAWNLALIDGEYLWMDATWHSDNAYGKNYFGLGIYAISKDHTATSAATFNGVKGPGTLIQGIEAIEEDQAETPEDRLARETIEALKSQYLEGMSWTNNNSYYSEGLKSSGNGCAGFAYICSDAVFGKVPAAETHSDFDRIRVGDILRIDNDTHSVVVLRKMSDSVIVTEGNYNGSIHWGRQISKANLEQGGLKVTTRWGTKALEKNADNVSSALLLTSGTAYASTQTVNVDGRDIPFQCYALKDENGNMTNYIKLRDLAILLNGSTAQFQVGWDGNVTITTGTAYTPNGTELRTPYSGDRAYQETTATTAVNGQALSLTAFVLNDDQGGGYTYYQLRDLGQTLGFNVGWSADKGIFLETNKPYDANN